jgi:hypothetical protein
MSKRAALYRIAGRRTAAWIALLALMCPAGAGRVGIAQSVAPLPDRWRGEWEIRRPIGAAAISALTDAQARAMVGTTIRLGEHDVAFQGQSCVFSAYSIVEETVEDFRSGYRITASELPLSGRRMTTLRLTCPRTAMPALTSLENGCVITSWDGRFFTVVKRVEGRGPTRESTACPR